MKDPALAVFTGGGYDKRPGLAVRLATLCIAMAGGLSPWVYQGPAEAGEEAQRLNRDQVTAQLQAFVLGAKQTLYVAATDCTFALISNEIRMKAEEPPLHGKVAVALQQEHRCPLPSFQAPRPYALKLKTLQPLRIDRRKNIKYRREFIIADDVRLFIALSHLEQLKPTEFLAYQADLSFQPDLARPIQSLGVTVWPSMFPGHPKGETGTDVRWSMTNHRRITRAISASLGFGEEAISLVEEGNVYVDRLSNQFNNPQHSMRNLGQTVADAQREASEWIATQRALALNEASRGNFCCALFSIGQAIHTIQDRKHKWIFLYQHLLDQIISDFRQKYAPEDWRVAHRDTREWCDTFLDEVGRLGGSALVGELRQTRDLSCECEGIKIAVRR